ncbi:MAG: hypothetical protein NVSMB42_13690 [Herpetosiphon sp.]
MYYDDEGAQSSGCVRAALLIAVALLAVGAVFYYTVNRTTSKIFPTLSNPLAAPTVVIDTKRPAVIQSIRSLNKLEATTFIAEKVIEAGQQGNQIYNFLLGDKLLLIAHGDVIAGFDLSHLREQDIIVNDTGDTVSLTLPPPEVLTYRLDNAKTRVYDRKTGIATRGNTELETQARRAAEVEILRAACDGGVLDRANTDGQRDIEALLRGLKFKQITVKTQPGQCVIPAPDGQSAPTATP